MAKVVAIHQPNFFPWLGYFDKIVRSDAFIFLDHVQFPKTGGIWTNRVKMLVNGEARWITAAIVRNYHGVRAICEMEYQVDGWREKILRTVTASYGKKPHHRDAMGFFEPLILNRENNIPLYNAHAVLSIAARLGIPSEKFHWSSRLPHEGHSNELLVSLTRAVGGDTYLCGGGAEGYQEEEVFRERGIVLRQQEFEHPVYPQGSAIDFMPGLSIVDAVMNVGWDEVRAMLGVRQNVGT